MSARMLSLILFFSSAAAAGDTGLYPDRQLTPGVIDPKATSKIVCVPGYTAGKDVRHVTLAMKQQVFQRYKVPWADHAKYEVDHLVSLELGGANAIENLWAQPYCDPGNDPLMTGCFGAREKDVVETTLHREVCAGHLTLDQAQQIIKTDWVAYWKKLKAGK